MSSSPTQLLSLDRRHSESSIDSQKSNTPTSIIEDIQLKPPSSKNQTIKILVVDDDATTRNVVSRLLKNLGYEAHTASGSRKALELLMQQEFHLMLVDVMMPEMDGYSLIRVFKQASSREIPSIMMSGSEDPETVAKCFQCGAEDFLPKPIKEEILKARIQKCLDYRDRKMRERFYKELIKEEKRLKEQLHEQRQKNKEQIEEFKKKVAETIETPLQVVMETISELMNGKYEAEQYKVALITIMKSLSSSDLYRPAFVDYVQNAKIDENIREWLVDQYSKDGEDALLHDSGTLSKRRKSKSEQGSRKSSLSTTPSLPNTIDDNEVLPFDLDSYTPDLKDNSAMNSMNYNSFDYPVEELKKHVMYMFKQLDLFEKFNFRPIRLWNLLDVLKTKYKGNFYHNIRHAIDVTQYVYIFITSEKIKDILTLSEKFMVLTAALCHDVDHPGVNNNFLINTEDELALVYNDRSVLENHHAAFAFKLLSDPRYNILEGTDEEFYREFRKTVINVILATDMANHFAICSKFQARISTGPLSNDSSEDRALLLKIIMKCADISNITRPFPIAKKWANMCIREFLHQGDLEKQRQIPVSPLMDRDTLNFPKSQIGFADFVAAPLFKHVVNAFPTLSHLQNSLLYNREQWQTIFEEGEKRNNVTVEALNTPATPSSLIADPEDRKEDKAVKEENESSSVETQPSDQPTVEETNHKPAVTSEPQKTTPPTPSTPVKQTTNASTLASNSSVSLFYIISLIVVIGSICALFMKK